jgi:hypothetical protein
MFSYLYNEMQWRGQPATPCNRSALGNLHFLGSNRAGNVHIVYITCILTGPWVSGIIVSGDTIPYLPVGGAVAPLFTSIDCSLIAASFTSRSLCELIDHISRSVALAVSQTGSMCGRAMTIDSPTPGCLVVQVQFTMEGGAECQSIDQ